MASNPMFLGLFCEYVREKGPVPENTHSLLDHYLNTRLTRDRGKLQRRFVVEPLEVRDAAERAAFCVAADPGLGLSPGRQSLKQAMERLGVALGERFDVLLDALEYIKIARSETATAASSARFFTFAHRRFQEYFATCVVLRQPDRISPTNLLTDARRRETAVVICQTQPPQALRTLLDDARTLLDGMAASVPGLIDQPLTYGHFD